MESSIRGLLHTSAMKKHPFTPFAFGMSCEEEDRQRIDYEYKILFLRLLSAINDKLPDSITRFDLNFQKFGKKSRILERRGE